MTDTAPDDPWENPFTDVRESDWFYGDVEYAATHGLMNGVSATTFDPNGRITRAMVITVLARIAGVDTDVGETWYSAAVEWGMTSGITDGTNMSALITREQLAAMLYRYAQTTGAPVVDEIDLTAFADADNISDWAQTAATWASANGIINGKPGGLFDPQGNATRAETAAMLRRYIER
jgi:hypothetical protein